MKKFNLSILIFLLSFIILSSVKAQTSYISFGDKTVSGITLQSGSEINNANYIIQISDSKEIKYTPNDLVSYQLRDGRLYVAREITDSKNDKVFLEVLVNGSYKLFYYRAEGSKKYYYSKPGNEELHKLTRQNLPSLREELKNNADCDQVSNAFKFLKVQHNSLIRFFKGLKDCDFFPYHRLKYGVNVGLSQVSFLNTNVENRYLLAGEYNYSNALNLGLFVEIPIDLTLTKIVTGVNYFSHQLSNEYTNLAGDVKTAIDFTAINIPLIFKFNIRDEELVRPFFQLGLTYDNLFKNTNTIEAEPRIIQSGGVTVVQEVGADAYDNFISNQYIGILIGIGTEFNINYRSEIKTEVNYSIKTGNQNTLNMSTINYSISYVF